MSVIKGLFRANWGQAVDFWFSFGLSTVFSFLNMWMQDHCWGLSKGAVSASPRWEALELLIRWRFAEQLLQVGGSRRLGGC